MSETNKQGLYPHPVAITAGKTGKLLVLDFNPTDSSAKLLEVRLHVPADVEILTKNLVNARSIVYIQDVVYICHYGAFISVFPPDGASFGKKLTKAALQEKLHSLHLMTDGTIPVLKERLNQHMEHLKHHYKEEGIDTSHVLLSSDISPSYITKASDTMLLMSSDTSRKVYSVSLTSDGIVIKGNVTELFAYPDNCHNIRSLAVSGNAVFCVVVMSENCPGGVIKHDLATHETRVLFQNQSNMCTECLCVTGFQDGIVFFDVGSHQLKFHNLSPLQPADNVKVVAGNRQEGIQDGNNMTASFQQITDICSEFDKNLYAVDIQSGTIRLITTMNGTADFLNVLSKLYATFNVHLDKGNHPLTLQNAVDNLRDIKHYLETTVLKAKELQGIHTVTNGPQGTISSKTVGSVQMLQHEMEHLHQTLLVLSPNFIQFLDLRSCITIAVENLHAIAHFKDQVMTVLQYARNLTHTVHEGLKRVVKWSAYYYTHRASYYPIPNHSVSLNELGKLSHLKPDHILTSDQQKVMYEWANEHGRCVRQRTVRQETTMYKAGTLPLNMYRSATRNQDPVQLQFEQLNENIESEPEEDIDEEEDIHSEYDSESDGDNSNDSDSDIVEDLNFLKNHISRSGRLVRANIKYYS